MTWVFGKILCTQFYFLRSFVTFCFIGWWRLSLVTTHTDFIPWNANENHLLINLCKETLQAFIKITVPILYHDIQKTNNSSYNFPKQITRGVFLSWIFYRILPCNFYVHLWYKHEIWHTYPVLGGEHDKKQTPASKCF